MTDHDPHIAILGAGPVGLDAALAAREAGIPFTVYEAAEEVGGHVREWSHVRLFTPWEQNVSPRMRRALADRDWRAPDPGAYPRGRDLVRHLLEPISMLPGVAENLRTGVRVLAVGRRGMTKSDAIGSPARGSSPFRILVRLPSGDEAVEEADVVLDCTGTLSNPNALGDGGIPAPGEARAGDRIVRRIPDLDAEPGSWTGMRILLVGSGHSAQTAARDLAAAIRGGAEIRLTWVVRSEAPDWGAVPDDPLPGRAELTREAEALTAGCVDGVELLVGRVVDAVRASHRSLRVALRRRFGRSGPGRSDDVLEVEVDRILSLTGSAGDHLLYRQLQVHECYATAGPMKLAAALLGGDSDDCLAQVGHGAESLVNPEPGFFLMGEKSYGRNNTFLMRIGWEQVDDVFGLLEGREGRGREGRGRGG